MDASTLSAVLNALGLTKFVPIVLAVSTLASALDAVIPQPAPGSHWLPVRKVLSVAALNVHYASNAACPPLVTWVQRVAAALLAVLPPPVPQAAEPVLVRVEPTLDDDRPGDAPVFQFQPSLPNRAGQQGADQ